METNPSCLIVTAYYQFPSKHSLVSYDQWMKNFLMTISNPMLIFCDAASEERIKQYRAAFMKTTWIFVLPLEKLHCSSIDWNKDWQRDTERGIHNPNLYIIWNEKSLFVYRAMVLQPHFDYYMWCDMGCFREASEMHMFTQEWPSLRFLKQAKKDRMYFLNIQEFQAGELEVLENGLTRSFEGKNRIGGTIFLGHKDIFIEWINVYYRFLEQYIAQDYFAGKDQNIMATVYAVHPELFELVRPVVGEGNPWFYLQRYFLGV
jgi:hypothetical protein